MARVRLSLSYTFYVGFSLTHTIRRSRSASFQISFGGTCSAYSCRLCALEEVNLGASCIAIVDQKFASYILKLDNEGHMCLRLGVSSGFTNPFVMKYLSLVILHLEASFLNISFSVVFLK